MRQLLHEVPVLLPLLIAFVTMVGVKVFFGVTFGGMFLALAGFIMPSRSGQGSTESSGKIVVGPITLTWQGVASTGLLVAGLLMIIMALYAYIHTHEII